MLNHKDSPGPTTTSRHGYLRSIFSTLAHFSVALLLIAIIAPAANLTAQNQQTELAEYKLQIAGKHFKITFSKDFEVIKNKKFNAHLLLKHGNGLPTLNIITVPGSPASSLKEQVDRDLRSYYAVGLTDSKVIMSEDIPLKGYLTTLSFTQQEQTRKSKILTIPYTDHSVVVTFLYKDERSVEKYWNTIKSTIEIPTQPDEPQNSPPAHYSWLIAVSVLLSLFLLYYLKRQQQL